MRVHKVLVKGKRGFSWIKRRGSEVVLIFRGGRVSKQCARESTIFTFKRLLYGAVAATRRSKESVPMRWLFRAPPISRYILRTGHIETDIDDGDLGRGEGGRVPHGNGQAQL